MLCGVVFDEVLDLLCDAAAIGRACVGELLFGFFTFRVPEGADFVPGFVMVFPPCKGGFCAICFDAGVGVEASFVSDGASFLVLAVDHLQVVLEMQPTICGDGVCIPAEEIIVVVTFCIFTAWEGAACFRADPAGYVQFVFPYSAAFVARGVIDVCDELRPGAECLIWRDVYALPFIQAVLSGIVEKSGVLPSPYLGPVFDDGIFPGFFIGKDEEVLEDDLFGVIPGHDDDFGGFFVVVLTTDFVV